MCIVMTYWKRISWQTWDEKRESRRMSDNLVTSGLFCMGCLSEFILVFTCAPSTFHPIIPRSPNIWVLCCVDWIRKDNKYTNLNKISMSGQQRIFFFNVRTVVKAWECFHKCPLIRMWMDLLAQEAQGLKEHLRVRSEFCVNKEPIWLCHIQKAQAFPVCPGGETIEVHIFLISWSWVELVTET